MPRRGLLVVVSLLMMNLGLPVGPFGSAAASGDSPPAAVASAAAEQCFPETGRCMRGQFYDYWLANGGLAQQGLPITDEFEEVNPTDGRAYLTQYFERARFEYHPENPPPYDVLLGLIGREQFLARYPQGRPPGGSGEVCFAATDRCVSGVFYRYWLANGGLAQQGYPISDEFDEVNPTDGQVYRTQYFERARFEHHHELAGTPYEVLLGLLGREQYEAKYGGGPPPGGALVTELVGRSYQLRGILGEPLTVRVTDARRTGAIAAGGGGSGATAPAGEVFIVVFYTATNTGRDLDVLADYACLVDSGGRCHTVDDDATEAATYLYDVAGPYEDVPAGATELGVMVYAVPAGASGFSLAPRRR